MTSSRIFVKGLPPTFTEADLRKHFTQSQGHVTDAKIYQSRRIGYVGYRTPEDAAKAVKYFNRTFIRMSRIGVELARPVEEASNLQKAVKPSARQIFDHRDGEISGSEAKHKRKRESVADEEVDPKLQEFLDVMGPKTRTRARENKDMRNDFNTNQSDMVTRPVADGQSDDEYEHIPKRAKTSLREPDSNEDSDGKPSLQDPPAHNGRIDEDKASSHGDEQMDDQNKVSDADWARSRTSRLLGLLDDEEEEDKALATPVGDAVDADSSEHGQEPAKGKSKVKEPHNTGHPLTPPPIDGVDADTPHLDADIAALRTSMRLFIRNLPYDVKEEDLEDVFASYGNLEEVHVPLDHKSGSAKGFAYVQFSDPDSAEQAFVEQDGQTFQGRLIHILPAAGKRDAKLDDFALSKLPLKKQQQIKRRREAASSTFNWNALYMNADAVVSSVANRLGLPKSEVLDPTSGDAAVKQAHAETHIIQETKSYFKSQGVDLDSFKQSRRGDTAILVKNIPYDCSRDELKALFDEHGEVKRLLVPPSGIIAIVEFVNTAQCKAAFGALAYRKMKNSVLFLEKAPKDVFAGEVTSMSSPSEQQGVSKVSTSDLQDASLVVPDVAGSATLFARNLNFTTTTDRLTESFRPLDGFLSARVKTKTDPKRPGEVLSMGFGFLEFRTARQAQAALQAIDGQVLEGHKLQVRASHKGMDAAEAQRKRDAEKRAAGQRTKVVIKNLPFEVTKKDVRALFGAYGQLRSVRVPKKLDRAARGFAFADFTTPKEAQSAMDALRDTHLLGRRLVLDFAADDPEDAEAEIEKMQQKVGAQVNKVALQKLTSHGRKKFTTQNDDNDT